MKFTTIGLTLARWIKQRSWIQRGILFLWLAVTVVMWPLCLIRDEQNNLSGSQGHAMTEQLKTGMSFTQNFYAKEDVLKTVKYVLSFDASQPLEGLYLIELLDSQGAVMYSSEYPYNITPEYTYCPIEVNVRMRPGDIYQFRLTNLNVEQNFPRVVYTQDADMHADNNCGMTFDGKEIKGEALMWYTWKVPMHWGKIAFYCSAMGLIAFLGVELEEVRMMRRKDRQTKINEVKKS